MGNRYQRMKYLASWFFQSWLAWLTPLAFGGVLGTFLTGSKGRTVNTLLSLMEWSVLSLCGALLGFLVGHLFPGEARTGSKVWVLPVIFFACSLVYDLTQLPLGSALAEFFTFSGRGPCCLAANFITYPVWSCCCYSAAIRRSAKDKRLPSRPASPEP